MTIEATGRSITPKSPPNVAKDVAQRATSEGKESSAQAQRRADGGDVVAKRRIAKEDVAASGSAESSAPPPADPEKGEQVDTLA